MSLLQKSTMGLREQIVRKPRLVNLSSNLMETPNTSARLVAYSGVVGKVWYIGWRSMMSRYQEAHATGARA